MIWFMQFLCKKQADGDTRQLQNNQRLFDMSSKRFILQNLNGSSLHEDVTYASMWPPLTLGGDRMKQRLPFRGQELRSSRGRQVDRFGSIL